MITSTPRMVKVERENKVLLYFITPLHLQINPCSLNIGVMIGQQTYLKKVSPLEAEDTQFTLGGHFCPYQALCQPQFSAVGIRKSTSGYNNLLQVDFLWYVFLKWLPQLRHWFSRSLQQFISLGVDVKRDCFNFISYSFLEGFLMLKGNLGTSWT